MRKNHAGTGRPADSFFRVVRMSIFGLVDSSAFEEVSFGGEFSNVFTFNGPVMYQ
jgi:hypothetical protein